MSPVVETRSAPSAPAPRQRSRRRLTRRRTSLFAHGEPMVWLTGGALVIALAMIAGLLLLVLGQGGLTFWPKPLDRFVLEGGVALMGEVTSSEVLEDGGSRQLVRTGNYDLTQVHFTWVEDSNVLERSRPEWGLVLERQSWGRFYGEPRAFLIDGETVAEDPAQVWTRFEQFHPGTRERYEQRKALETHEIGRLNARIESARLAEKSAELDSGADSPQWQRAHERFVRVQEQNESEFDAIREEITQLNAENERYGLVLETADGTRTTLSLADVVRAYPANQLGFADKLGVYLSRWWEFLSDDPREANSEGGVFPAIFGTVVMTLLMSIVVVPFGVLAALYLREYAKQGTIVSMVRIAVNNLAGVPSIAFGVFGLGFFCYIIGASMDELLFEARLPNPTYGKGGLLWAALTLALLTLPVVIVATEEALSAVPNSMREGSYACGATKWQTIRRIVLPRAAPGIMTGMILAIARGAGEVAPLMLVGAVKLAPELPLDGNAPFLHPERSFMHLGFHIFDLGFQSQNSEAAKPMVYTTTLLLIGIVVSLNVLAVLVRGRLRRRFMTAHI